MTNTKPEDQSSYYQVHAPKCVAHFVAQAARLDHMEFDGHGFSGRYPDELAANPNIVFALKCLCGSSRHRIVAASEGQEIWRYKNLVIAERYFLECESCHSRRLLFDRFLHGYDAESSQMEGVNLREFIETNQPPHRNIEVVCECPNCRNTTFEVFTRFEYPSDLFEEPLFEGREQEFFSWFTGVGRCSTCSATTVFIDFECA